MHNFETELTIAKDASKIASNILCNQKEKINKENLRLLNINKKKIKK